MKFAPFYENYNLMHFDVSQDELVDISTDIPCLVMDYIKNTDRIYLLDYFQINKDQN